MTARWAGLAAGACVAGAAALLAFSHHGGAYHVRLALADAAGLRDGSPVTIGGVTAGRVSLRLGTGDRVIADLALDRAHAPVGRDASASISAVNLLGQKRLELDPGTRAKAAPSGFEIPASRVTTSTDLDQVLSVLDADTRTRLAVLIDEAGGAFHARRADISRVLFELPPALQRGTALMDDLVADNHTLADLVTRTDGLVGELAARRGSLTRMIDATGQAAHTVAARRAQLRQTLARAPGALAALRSFLGELRATTIPLGPAARELTATAPALSRTLGALEPFRRAATPALVQARAAAPRLTRLADGATPVLRRATPAVRGLAAFATALQPVSGILDHSVDNMLAVVENWSRAIQFRDGLSHVFRGEASITPDTLRSIIGRLAAARRTRHRHQRPAGARPLVHVPDVTPKAPALPKPPAVKPPVVKPPALPPVLDDALHGKTPPVHAPDGQPVLDYLLGD